MCFALRAYPDWSTILDAGNFYAFSSCETSTYFYLAPPDHIVAMWSEWLKNGGYTGTLAEMEQAYLKSNGCDNWSEYLFDIEIDWHFNQQKRKFWAFFAKTFPPQATVTQ